MQTPEEHQDTETTQRARHGVVGGSGLQEETHAEQQAVEHPELGFKKDVLDLPRHLIHHPRPSRIISTKIEHVDQQDPEQSHAA